MLLTIYEAKIQLPNAKELITDVSIKNENNIITGSVTIQDLEFILVGFFDENATITGVHSNIKKGYYGSFLLDPTENGYTGHHTIKSIEGINFEGTLELQVK